MNAKNAKKPPEVVASITVTVLRNSGGALYCDTKYAPDEPKPMAYDVGKMRLRLPHCCAALGQIADRMLELELEKMRSQLQEVHPKAVPATNERDIR